MFRDQITALDHEGAPDVVTVLTRSVDMDNILNCGGGSWFMIAAGIATYGVLALAGAALVKYLFFSRRTEASI